MESTLVKVEIFMDDRLIHEFNGVNAIREAHRKMLWIQPQSVSWAIKHGGYSVVESWSDGTKNKW